ncbi:hypothetical protein V8E36_002904, partial [Tilletia maclaganii]
RNRREPTPTPPPVYDSPPIVNDSDTSESELSALEEEVEVVAVSPAPQPAEALEAAQAPEPSDTTADVNVDDAPITVAHEAVSPCRSCYVAGRTCLVAPGGLTCQACTKTACNVNRRVPSFKGDDAALRARIYKRLLAASGAGATYVPPKLNPSNDWTSRYLQDVLGEAALSDPDIRAHLDRSGTRNHPGRAGTAAANAPAHVQPSLASGSNAQAPSYNIDPQTAAERKRAMEDAEKALEYHEGGAK